MKQKYKPMLFAGEPVDRFRADGPTPKSQVLLEAERAHRRATERERLLLDVSAALRAKGGRISKDLAKAILKEES